MWRVPGGCYLQVGPPTMVRLLTAQDRLMKRAPAADDPDAYVAALAGWQRELVERLRAAVLAAAELQEVIKWGHLVYLSNGPVLLIRVEAERVLFGLWRGQQLRQAEPRLKPGGKYEMATLELREGDRIDPDIAVQLTRAAVELNERLGDPARSASPR